MGKPYREVTDRFVRMDVIDSDNTFLERWKVKVNDKKNGLMITTRMIELLNISLNDIEEYRRKIIEDDLSEQQEILEN